MAVAERKTQKWGNSIGVRIPKSMADHLQIGDSTDVYIKEEGDRIIIEKKKDLTLEEMVDMITEENKHEFVDFGEPVGRELL